MEQAPSPFKSEDMREALSPRVVASRAEAIAEILKEFEKAQARNYGDLAFHHEGHLREVRHNAREFAEIIMSIDPSLVTEETLEEIVGSAASHDSVLNSARGQWLTRLRGFYDSDLQGEGKRQLRDVMEKAGILKGNERMSAERLDQELKRYVDKGGKRIFDGRSRDRMWLAIAATLPEFDFQATIPDEEYEKHFREGVLEAEDLEAYRTGLKIWQPHLRPDSYMVELAVAQADLRGAVSNPDFEVFKKSGNAEFRESVLWVREALKNGTENVNTEDRERIASAILSWIKSQVSFAMWQKVLFWKAINENELINGSAKRGEIHKALAERYDANFDKNILAAKQRAETVDGLALEDLLIEIGYDLKD